MRIRVKPRGQRRGAGKIGAPRASRSIDTVLVCALACALAACSGGEGDYSLAGAAEQADAPPISLDPPPDDRVRARLAGVFRQLGGLEEVRVRVRDGVVRLEGVTESVAIEQRATKIAARVEGVIHVASAIEQPASPWRPLASMGASARALVASALKLVPRLGAAILVMLPFAAVAALLARWRRPGRGVGGSPLTGNLIRQVLRAVLWFVGALLALHVLGILGTVGTVVGALGIIGVVVGLVFRDWIANYLPGVMLALHPPFKAGDLVRLGQHEGRVARITPSATVLVTADGEEIRIPNADFFRETLVNFSHHRERRLRVRLKLAAHADLSAAEDLGCEALLRARGILAEPPPFMRTGVLGQDEVEVEFFAWMDQDVTMFRDAESGARRAVMEALLAGGLPRPETTISIRRPGAAADAGLPPDLDRSRAPAPSAKDHDRARAQDRALVDRHLDRARTAPGERDLLAEGTRRPAGVPLAQGPVASGGPGGPLVPVVEDAGL